MPELKEVLEGVLVKAHGFTAEEVSSLFSDDGTAKEEALDSVLNRVAEKVKKDRDQQKLLRDQQLMRGRRESAERLEKFLKAEGVDLGDLTFESDEAFEKVREAIKGPKAAPAATDENAIKSSDIFKKRERELLKALDDLKAEHTSKWSERDAKDQRDRTLSVVKDKAKTILDGLKPVLSQDPERARTQLGFFFAELEKQGYDIDGDQIIVKDAEGKRIETDHGNPQRFEDFVKSTASRMYDFQVSEQKSNAGNVAAGTKGQGAGAGKKPANRRELAAELASIADNTSLKSEEKLARMKELKELEPSLPG